MKKGMIAVLVLGFLMIAVQPVSADAGPKPELRITLINPPDEPYLLDLLVEPNCTECWVDDDRFEGLDPTLVVLLQAQATSAWVGALTHGLSYPIFGNLEGRNENGQRVHTFTYRLPDAFKIIVVTQSGNVVISDVITRDVFMMALRFDVASGEIIRPTLWKQVVFQIGSTLLPTLIVEGVLLLLFGLWSRRNLWVMLLANLLTQIVLTLTMGLALIYGGLLAGMVVFLLMEGVVILIEAVLYGKFFDKTKRLRRRIAYAIIANFASFITGFVVITETYLFFLQL